MTQKLRILVVEDETPIREGLCDVLAYHGYAPEPAVDGTSGLAAGRREAFDLVVLDVMMPGLSGFEVCEKLRAHQPHLPILLLTAKDSEDDIVQGLRLGADDYVTKPFSIRELVARIEALLRRSGKLHENETFAFGPWTVDVEGLRAVYHEDTVGKENTVCTEDTIDLTAREVALLRVFAREAGRVVSRRVLMREVWDVAHPQLLATRTVDVHIAKLRKKIDRESTSLIQAVRGSGYRAIL